MQTVKLLCETECRCCYNIEIADQIILRVGGDVWHRLDIESAPLTLHKEYGLEHKISLKQPERNGRTIWLGVRRWDPQRRLATLELGYHVYTQVGLIVCNAALLHKLLNELEPLYRGEANRQVFVEFLEAARTVLQ